MSVYILVTILRNIVSAHTPDLENTMGRHPEFMLCHSNDSNHSNGSNDSNYSNGNNDSDNSNAIKGRLGHMQEPFLMSNPVLPGTALSAVHDISI